MTANTYGAADRVAKAGDVMTGQLSLPSFKMTTGPATGSILTSDAAGNASWQPPPATSFLAPDHGYLAWSYDPGMSISYTAVTSGTLYLAQIRLRVAQTISKLTVSLGSAASGVTANQNFLGLYDSTGTLRASTAAGAIDSALTSAGPLLGTLTASYQAAAGAYWVAFLSNATTAAQLARATTLASTANAGLSASQYRWCTNGTSLTALPASITPASNSLTNQLAFWAATS